MQVRLKEPCGRVEVVKCTVINFSFLVVLVTGKLSVDIGNLRWLRELSLQLNYLKGTCWPSLQCNVRLSIYTIMVSVF